MQTNQLAVPIRRFDNGRLAYADNNRSGSFDKDIDAAVMLEDLRGDESYGASTVSYDDLLAAVKAAGGRASSEQVCAWFREHHGPPRATDGDKVADGYRMTASPTVPPGVPHPVVSYAFALVGDELQLQYNLQSRAGIVRDDQIAILDNDGDGRPNPQHDSLLTLHIRNDATRQTFIGNMVPYDKLEQAIREGGGRISEAELYQRLTALVLKPGSDAQVSHMSAAPDPLQHVGRPVQKTFGQAADGSLYVDYQLGDGNYFYGGWEAR